MVELDYSHSYQFLFGFNLADILALSAAFVWKLASRAEMTKKLGRDFEEMVARIEERLAPNGAIVNSPDYITDKVTGQPREVDASIRYKVVVRL